MFVMDNRKSARSQPLPPHEVERLNALTQDELVERVYHLYQAGWALQAIGDALQPRRPRSTVRSWVLRYQLPTERDLVDAPIDIPTPTPKAPPKGTKKRRADAPGLLPDETELIQSLAPLARTYRSRMSSTSAAAVANDRLTAVCIRLYNNGVSIKELAHAAGVTYRAMYKRVKL